MAPEQIPGSLFVLIVVAVALQSGNEPAALVMALGCAFGWQTFNPNPSVRSIAMIWALLLWAIGFGLTVKGIL